MTTATLEKPEAAMSVAGELADLIGALEFARYAICHGDKTRPYLEGVRLDWERGGLRVAATDGHRLHVAVLPYNAPDHAERLFLLKADDVARLLKTYSTKRSQNGKTFVLDYRINVLTVYRPMPGGIEIDCLPCEGWQPEDEDCRLRNGARPKEWAACFCDLHRVIPHDPPPVFTAVGTAFVGFLDAMLGAGKVSGWTGCAFKIVTTPDPVVKDSGQVVLSGSVPAGRGYTRHAVNVQQDRVEEAEVCKPFCAGYNASYVRDIMRAFGEHRRLYLMAHDATGPAVWHAAVSSHFSAGRGDRWRVLQDRFVVLMPCRV